jgi:hypothetical protein
MTARQVVKRFGHLTLVCELRTTHENDIIEIYQDAKGLHFGLKLSGDIVIMSNSQTQELQSVYGN